jgi:hypothetical protein
MKKDKDNNKIDLWYYSFKISKLGLADGENIGYIRCQIYSKDCFGIHARDNVEFIDK